MSSRKFLYEQIWKNYTEKIHAAVKASAVLKVPIPAQLFRKAGNRKRYNFRLEIKNGAVVNNIDGSAVARDLAHVLLHDSMDAKLFFNKHIIFVMNTDFNFIGCNYDIREEFGLR